MPPLTPFFVGQERAQRGIATTKEAKLTQSCKGAKERQKPSKEEFTTEQTSSPVRIHEEVLFLVCRPDVLKENCAFVKDALTSTNQDYEEEKRQLIPLLQNKSDTGANADDAVPLPVKVRPAPLLISKE